MQKPGRQAAAAGVLLLVCCSLLQPSTCSASKDSKPLAQPDYSLYLRKDDFLRRVREVVAQHPDIMKYETRHAKDGDYKADVMVVTVEPSGLRPTHKSKARLLLDFGEHGREFITSEVGLRFLQVLGDPEQLSKLVGGGKRAARLQAILQQCAFKIVPMENVAGRDLVEAGNLCERKNGRGVDPNRNWDIDWGVKEKDYDPKEEYPGRAALSEPEVQVLLSLAKQLKPHVWLNVHSGMYALFTPYDHKGHVPNTTDARAALRMMTRIQDLICPQCKVGSGGHTVGYLAHGTATDYMFEVLKTPMSFTWEIYGDESASYEDCFKMFNPLGKQHFEDVVELWVKALLQLIELLPTHPATWPYFKKLGLDRWEAVVPQDASKQQQKQQQGPPPATQEQQQQETSQQQPEQQQSEAATTEEGDAAEAEESAATPAEQTDPATGSKAAELAAPPKQTPQGQQQQQPEQQPPPEQQQPEQIAEQQSQTPAEPAAVEQVTQAGQQQQGVTEQQGPDVAPAPAVQPTSQPKQQQQPQQQEEVQPPASEADSTDVSLEEHLAPRSSKGRDTALVLMNKVLPWAIGLLGFGGLLYCVTRGSGKGYRPLPVRQPLPGRR